MSPQGSRFCCTSPSALCFWGATFMVLYGAGLLAFTIWPDFWAFDQTLLLAALGVACLVNFGVNRTFHCGITGPMFLVAAAAVGLGEVGYWEIDDSLVWALMLIGIGGAGFLEWRVTRDSAHA